MAEKILALETSCDETSASVIDGTSILSNVISTQVIHQKHGGVIPEIASREHQKYIIPIIQQALDTANINKEALSAVAFTRGPGLLGALLVGCSTAKAISMALKIPLIEVNHMHAHILSHFIDEPKPSFPFLCLTASGGHTQLVIVKDYLELAVIGETRDDAVGEAFDKTAKLLGFDYPGGPLMDKYSKGGDPLRFSFPDTDMKDLDFSFSGIKTAVNYFLRDELKSNPDFIKNNLTDLCASIQHSLVKMLLSKLKKAVKQHQIEDIAIAGGVSVNSYLRNKLIETAEKHNWKTYIPKPEYCTDNAAMIATTAHYKFQAQQFAGLDAVPDPRLKL